jgi:hypothetical protein
MSDEERAKRERVYRRARVAVWGGATLIFAVVAYLFWALSALS